MISKNYSVVFIPFNTNQINDNENDTVIAKHVLDKIDEQKWLLNIDDELTIDDMNYVMSRLDICIPMRFHSVLFCMYNMIPFVSVYSTRKIHNLLLDTYWDYKYILRVNDCFVPTEFDSSYLIEQVLKLEKMIVNRKNIYHKLLILICLVKCFLITLLN
jgi:polysaccharide pyruvyl transferase WcaK-like protein